MFWVNFHLDLLAWGLGGFFLGWLGSKAHSWHKS